MIGAVRCDDYNSLTAIDERSASSFVADCKFFLSSLYERVESVDNEPAVTALAEEAVQMNTVCISFFYTTVAALHKSLRSQIMLSDEQNSWKFVALLESLARSKSLITVLGYRATLESRMRQKDALTPMASFTKLLVELAFNSVKESAGQDNYIEKRTRDVAAVVVGHLFRDLLYYSLRTDQPIMETPNRFKRTSSQPNWDMATGAADAIAFRVNKTGVILAGLTVYIGTAIDYQYSVELVLNQGDVITKDSWHILEKVVGTLSVSQSSQREFAYIRFNKPVRLIPGNLYATRVFIQGGKTWAGDRGIQTVALSETHAITFEMCSLSLNGTNITRGQIPSLLVSIEMPLPPGEKELDKEDMQKQFMQCFKLVINKLINLIQIGKVVLNRSLLNNLFGWAAIFIPMHPTYCLDLISALDEVVPLVAAINNQHHSTSTRSERQLAQAIVESEHPYLPNSQFSQLVSFDETVQIMSLDFHNECCTNQSEDSLTVYIQLNKSYFHPIGRYSTSKNWPKGVINVPGNKLWFVFETSRKNEACRSENAYGFRCTITGYKNESETDLMTLEQEMVWLCSLACRTIFEASDKANIADLGLENDTYTLIQKYGALLRKGFALSHWPTVHESMKRSLPSIGLSPEIKFLKEFIAGSSTSLAGSLARWLTSEPCIDLESCELSIPAENICVGHPVMVHVMPKDQYGRMAICPDMKCMVTIKSGSCDGSYPSMKSLPLLSELQGESYQPTYLNKARYTSITMMQKFHKFSFEELRMGFFRDAVMKEDIVMVPRNEFLEGTWIPRHPGLFRIECRLDGFQLGQTYHIEVFKNEALAHSKLRSKKKVAQLSKARFAVLEISSITKGVRIRSAPSLAAQQIGIMTKGSVISYMEEIQNSDGSWLRLTDESVALLCGAPVFPNQAWVLQYNKHLCKMLLVKTLDESAILVDGISNHSIVIETQEKYQVINKAESEDNHVLLYMTATLSSESSGRLSGGAIIQTDLWIHNSDGVWVRLMGTEHYCLAQSKDGHIFLERKSFSSSQSSVSTGSSYEGSAPLNPNGLPGSAEGRSKNRKLSFKRKQQAGALCSPLLNKPIEAMRPAKIDCCRTVFSAFVWHENFVKDVMACAAYLRYHPELSSSSEQFDDEQLPSPLVPIIKLWTEIRSSVLNSIQQHVILPSPPLLLSANRRAVSGNLVAIQVGDELCELCEEFYAVPVTNHMRAQHPGCGRHAGGHGYNSLGRYTSGWSGNCGEGGRHPATWYLMCPSCRRKYLKQTPSTLQLDQNRRFHLLNTCSSSIEPHAVIRANAVFLLELNQSADDDSKNTSENSSGWAINLFPSSSTPPSVTRSTGIQTLEEVRSAKPIHKKPDYVAHASDPGPKFFLNTMSNSVPCSEPPGAILHRRRVTATDTIKEVSAGILRSPSTALKSFISSQINNQTSSSVITKRPVLNFVIQHHDLKKIKEAIESATFRAAIFSHCFKVWNWLLRLVSMESSVCDVLWHYLTALTSYKSLIKSDIHESMNHTFLMPHPWRICFLAGPLANKMVCSFHALLHTISVILRSDCVEPNLRRLCFRSWTFNLTIHEQDLVITTCNILATVGQVLAEPLEGAWLGEDISFEGAPPVIKTLDNLAAYLKIEASSRSAMVKGLTDGNMETFWESSEDEKQKTKILTVSLDDIACEPLLLSVYIDNEKDEGFRTSQIIFYALNIKGSKTKKYLTHFNLGTQFMGWCKCYIPNISEAQIEIKSPDSCCRVRHLCVLGRASSKVEAVTPSLKPSPSHLLMFTAAQTDAFQLFQAVAAQAFSDEFSTDQNGTLRYQVLDLLFSRIQMHPLQGYVCSQIAVALQKEVETLRDRGKKNYSYCCGLLSMLSKICSSKCPIEALSSKGHLLSSLSELLVFSSTVVQFECLDAIEKVLLHINAVNCDVKKFVLNLLIAVAKQICIQVRHRTTHTVTSATMQKWLQGVPPYWRLDKPPAAEMTKLVKTLLIDLANGRFSSKWAQAIQKEVAAHVMHLTSIGEESRTSDQCLKSSAFWISTAALSVLQNENWLTTSSQYQQLMQKNSDVEKPLCENHDDGHTIATFYCDSCALSLCRDCYTVLHLNKRTRKHTVNVLALGDACPEIDIHEGSTRFRLPWLLVLLNSAAMNGMLEFCNVNQDLIGSKTISKSRQNSGNKQCRFCGNLLQNELASVCEHADCQTMVKTVCCKTHPCGHLCGGVLNESQCLPCLRCKSDNGTLRQDNDDLCVICFTDRLGAAPAIHLECAHVFHYHCIKTTVSKRWNGPRIVFNFLNCPLCKAPIQHKSLQPILAPLMALYNEVASKAKLRLEYDGLMECPSLKSQNSPFFNDPVGYALDRYVYVLCNKCGKAYFGGESQCQQVCYCSRLAQNP